MTNRTVEFGTVSVNAAAGGGAGRVAGVFVDNAGADAQPDDIAPSNANHLMSLMP